MKVRLKGVGAENVFGKGWREKSAGVVFLYHPGCAGAENVKSERKAAFPLQFSAQRGTEFRTAYVFG